MKKRLLQLLLCAALCLTLLPVTASADDVRWFCGTCGSSAGMTCGHDNYSVPYTVIKSNTQLPTTTGHYYLDHAVTLSSPWTPKGTVVLYLDYDAVIYGPNGNSVIELSGCTFTLTGPAVGAGTITHKSGQLGRGVRIYDDSKFNMYHGNITGNTVAYSRALDYRGGGVYNAGEFNMYGGTISNNNLAMDRSAINEKDYVGGGVCNFGAGTFNMYGGTISGNRATVGGGVHNRGTFNMSGGEISQNEVFSGFHITGEVGGGVYVDKGGNFVMSGGTIKDNKAASGGGVYVSKTYVATYTNKSASFTLDGGTISSNTATNGGGIYRCEGTTMKLNGGTLDLNSATNGGGLYIEGTGTFTIATAITRNDADYGGGVYTSGTVTLKNTTIGQGKVSGAKGNLAMKQGGGVFVNGTLTLDNCTVTGNRAVTHGGGVYVANKANFTLSGGTITENQVGNGKEDTARYGGGVFNAGTMTMNNSPTISYNAKYGSRGGEKLDGAGIYNNGKLTMNDGTIRNNTGKHGAAVYVASGKTFTMNGGTLENNRSSGGSGGAVAVLGTFNMKNATIKNNRTGNLGGGVYIPEGGTFNMNAGSTISNCSGEHGGGVFNQGTFNMTNATISGCTATNSTGHGGGLCADASAKLVGATIQYNTADLGGGVFVGEPNALTMDADTQIIYNTAKKGNNHVFSRGSGGGIYVFNGASLTLNGGTIAYNTATNGGGIGGEGALTLNGSVVISDNTATNDGGGLYLYEYATFTINDGTISGNKATHGGGAAFNTSPRGLTINGGTITGNTANNGGGIYNASGHIAESFIDALSKEHVYNPSKGPVLNLNGGTISGNTARTRGGGVFAIDGGKDTETRVRISGTASVVGNTVSDKANNIYLDGTDLQIVRTGFSGTAGITKKDAKINETRILTTYIEYFMAPDVVSQYAHRFAYDDPNFAIKQDGWLGCAHKNVNESGTCTDCGAVGFVFKVESGAQKGNAVNYYQRLETAMSALTDGGTLTLLADVPATMELNSPVTYTLDMNDKKAETGICVSAGSVTIKNCTNAAAKTQVDVNGGEAVIPDGTFGNVNVGGGTATISGGTFNRLTVNSGDAKLSGGTFSVIRNFRGGDRGTVGALLVNNYGYWNEDKEDWRDDRYQVVENTTVKSTLVALEINPATAELTYGYTSGLNLTAAWANADVPNSTTYQWTLDGAADTAQTGKTYTFPTGKPAGDYTVTCTATLNGTSYTAKTVVKVKQVELETILTAPTAKDDLIYNGTALELVNAVTGTMPTGCKAYYKLGSGEWTESTTAIKATDAGSYIVQWYVSGDTNHAGIGSAAQPKELTVKIAPKTVEIDSAEVNDKIYDATSTATVKSVGFKNDTLSMGDDFAVTDANFTDTAIGDNKDVNVSVKLLNDNYAFANHNTRARSTLLSSETTFTASGKIVAASISNADAPLKRYVKANTTYNYQINDLLDGLTGSAVYSTITWNSATLSYTDGLAPATDTSDNCQVTSAGKLTVKIADRTTSATTPYIGRLALTGSGAHATINRTDSFLLSIDVYLTSSDVLVRSGTLSKNAITYGDPLSKSVFADGSYLVTPDAPPTHVSGHFEWINPDRVPDAGIRWAEWLFTPDNDSTTQYQPVNGAGAVTVNKATPTVYLIESDATLTKLNSTSISISRTYNGSPIAFTAKHYIYTVPDDSTTGSYVLTPVPGTWTWKRGETFVSAPVNAQSDQTYTVTFTPSDTTNYNSVSFTVTVTITPKTLTITDVTATGRVYEPNNKIVTLSGGTLHGVADSDLTRVSFSLGEGEMVNADAGDDKSVNTDITLIGNAAENYTLTQPTDVKVTITPKTLTRSMVTMDTSYLTYNGRQQSPSFTVKDGDTPLTSDCYTVSGDTSATNAGDYKLTITAKERSNYTGSITDIPWYIDPKPITADMVTITAPTYNGNEQSATITVTGGATYTVSGDTATDVGSRTLTILGTGNYEGRLPLTWSLKPKTINASASVADKRYDGTTDATGTVTLTGGLRALEEERDYLYTAAFADADAGTDKTAYVQVTLLNPNYCFEGGLSTITLNCTADITGTSGGRYHGGSISAESAPTGDAGIALYAVLALTSCTGSALVLRSKKREF